MSDCYVFTSYEFPDIELYATKTHFIIKELGPSVHYFNVPAAAPPSENTESEKQLSDLPVRGRDGFEREQIEMMINAGIMVDDEN